MTIRKNINGYRCRTATKPGAFDNSAAMVAHAAAVDRTHQQILIAQSLASVNLDMP